MFVQISEHREWLSTVGSVSSAASHSSAAHTDGEILTKHYEHILKIYGRIASMGCLSDTTKQHASKWSDNTDTIKISKNICKKYKLITLFST